MKIKLSKSTKDSSNSDPLHWLTVAWKFFCRYFLCCCCCCEDDEVILGATIDAEVASCKKKQKLEELKNMKDKNCSVGSVAIPLSPRADPVYDDRSVAMHENDSIQLEQFNEQQCSKGDLTVASALEIPKPTNMSSQGNLHELTKRIEEKHGSKGDLIVALKFEIPEHTNTSSAQRNTVEGTLHVLVKEVKNLCPNEPYGNKTIYCKSYLLSEKSRSVKQKTSAIRWSHSSRWDHSFLYRSVSLSDLELRALELSVWEEKYVISGEFIGGVRFSVGEGQAKWMDSDEKEVSMWQTMIQRPNFLVEGSVSLRPSLSN